MYSQDLIEDLLDIELREENLNNLITKRDTILQEIKTISDNTPAMIESNKQTVIFNYSNQDFLSSFTKEIDSIEDQQSSIINNVKHHYKETIEGLVISEEYTKLKKSLGLNDQELLSYIHNDLMTTKMSQVDFVN